MIRTFIFSAVSATTVLAAEQFSPATLLPNSIHKGETMAVTYADFDGDGNRDIVAAGFAGDFYWSKNTGNNKKPQFAKPKKLFSLEHW